MGQKYKLCRKLLRNHFFPERRNDKDKEKQLFFTFKQMAFTQSRDGMKRYYFHHTSMKTRTFSLIKFCLLLSFIIGYVFKLANIFYDENH